MYKSVEEIKALIEDSKNRKYMSMTDTAIEVNKSRALDPHWVEKNQKALKKRKERGDFKKAKHLKQFHQTSKKFKETEKFKDLIETLREMKFKRVVTPIGIFESIQEASENLNCHHVKQKIKKFPHLYYLEETGPGEPTYETVYYSRFGEHNTKRWHEQKARDAGIVTQKTFGKKWNYSCWNWLVHTYEDFTEKENQIRRDWDLD